MLKSTSHPPYRTVIAVLGHNQRSRSTTFKNIYLASLPPQTLQSSFSTTSPLPQGKKPVLPLPKTHSFTPNIQHIRHPPRTRSPPGGPFPDLWVPEFPLDPVPSNRDSAQRIASGNVYRYGMDSVGNRRDAPPKHEMVYFPGLLTKERRFGDFRTVLHTGLYGQVVAMEVPVGGEIGDEVHTVDQILLFTSGKGLATVAGRDQVVKAGDVVVVPAGTQHQFITEGDEPLELLTIYAPAEHNQKTVHKTKEEGDAAEDAGTDEAPAWSRKSKKENEDAGLVRLDAAYDNERYGN